MKDLKDIIDKNRILFDDQEPETGHFERFEKRLGENRSSSSKRIHYLWISGIAASLLLVFLSIQFQNNKNADWEDSALSAQMYYQGMMDEEIESIECKLDMMDPESRSELREDLLLLQEGHEEFIQNIPNHPDKELATKYMIEHFRFNLERLQSLNEKLENYYNC